MKRVWINFAGALAVAMAAAAPASAQFVSLSGINPPGSSEGNPAIPDYCTSVYGTTYTCKSKPGLSSYNVDTSVAGFRWDRPQSFIQALAYGWFDPVAELGFRITIPSGAFTSVAAPTFYGLMLNFDTTWLPLTAGSTSPALTGLRSFDVYGLGGNGSSGYFPTSLPPTLTIGLKFTGNPAYMDWTYLTTAIPEAGTLTMLVAGLAVLYGVRRRGSRSRRR